MNVITVEFRQKTARRETILSYSAMTIAESIIRNHPAGLPTLSPMKLQKLIYYAHGWCLALTGEPLVDEHFEAWDYGPVISSLYHRLKGYGNTQIPLEQIRHAEPVGDKTTALLDAIIRKYGKYSALELSDMTHQPGSPWAVSRKPGTNAIISNETIMNSFKLLLNE